MASDETVVDGRRHSDSSYLAELIREVQYLNRASSTH